MKSHFSDTIKGIQNIASYAETIEELALLVGAKEQGLNFHNAVLACKKALLEYLEYKKQAQELGITIGESLRSLKLRKNSKNIVPDELKFAPPHWVEESSVEKISVWKNSRKVDKVYKTRGISPAMVHKLRAGIQNQLEELFLLLQQQDWSDLEKEKYRSEVIESYKNDSYGEFTYALTRALWALSDNEYEFPEEREDIEAGTLSWESSEFQECVESAIVYSEPIRQHLEEWAKDNDIRIHKALLEGWAAEYPDRLFSHLMRKRFQKDRPISDWILLALTERNLASGNTLGWSDQVSFEMIERLVEESQKMESGEMPAKTHNDIIDFLAETTRQFTEL